MTGAEFFAKKSLPNPQSGAAHDTIWSSALLPETRILNAMGYGAQENWGSNPGGGDIVESLRKAGIFNDYQGPHDSLIKSVNEAWMRPAIEAAASLFPAVTAATAGVASGLGQTANEAEAGNLGPGAAPYVEPLKAAAELTQGAAEGAFMNEGVGVPHAAAELRATEATTARAAGVVGEGEAGYYDAVPPTPENLEARANAAHDAGIEPPPSLPPPPDVHALARRIDPETFQQFDSLAAERDQYRAEITRLGEERVSSSEAIAAKDDLNKLLGVEDGVTPSGSIEERLSAIEASAPEGVLNRLDVAMRRYETAVDVDTPEMADLRSKMMGAEFAMRDLAEPLSAAYRQAREMAPQLPETVPVLDEKQLPGEQAMEPLAAGEERPAEAAPKVIPAAVADTSGAFEPPSVTGAQTLGEGAQLTQGVEKQPAGRTSSTLKAIQGGGEERVRRVSQRTEENAIAAGLAETFGDLPTYGVLKDKDQAAIVTKLMNEDYARSKAIAMGTREPPKGVTPEAFLIGVENRTKAEGDFETAHELVNSKLATAATTMGQRLSTYRTRTKLSPVEHIREVQSAREAEFARTSDIAAAKRDTVSEIKAEVRKVAPKADAWANFIKTIECS